MDTIRRLGFGQIRALRVRGGEPVFEPPPVIEREVKFGSPRPNDSPTYDNTFTELFDALKLIEDGVVDRLEVRNGRPFRIIVPELPPAPGPDRKVPRQSSLDSPSLEARG